MSAANSIRAGNLHNAPYNNNNGPGLLDHARPVAMHPGGQHQPHPQQLPRSYGRQFLSGNINSEMVGVGGQNAHAATASTHSSTAVASCADAGGGGLKKKEIYKYVTPWPAYSMNWSARADRKFRLAVGSFIEEYTNKVEIVTLLGDESSPDTTAEFRVTSHFDHPYPTTKIMWIPDTKGVFPDLLATSGDYLRLWRPHPECDGRLDDAMMHMHHSGGPPSTARLVCLLNNNKNSEFCAPLTSFDWNQVEPNLIGTSSIDTTCTIWALETGQIVGRVNMVSGQVKTQLIAHDKEVYDVAFSLAGGGRNIFASVGADGSVRMFDLRHLKHSTIIYDDPQQAPLLRVACNKQDPNYLATFAQDSCDVIVIDIRVPCIPVARLANHRACINGIAWAPHSAYHICTAADDNQALIWDVQRLPRPVEDPILAYTAQDKINQIQWGSSQPDWVAICYDKCLEILRV